MAKTKTKRTKDSKQTIKISEISTKEYAQTLAELKKHIQKAQVKAALSANKELIKLYWTIGKTIAEKQETSGWGSSVIESLAKDLQAMFPGDRRIFTA